MPVPIPTVRASPCTMERPDSSGAACPSAAPRLAEPIRDVLVAPWRRPIPDSMARDRPGVTRKTRRPDRLACQDRRATSARQPELSHRTRPLLIAWKRRRPLDFRVITAVGYAASNSKLQSGSSIGSAPENVLYNSRRASVSRATASGLTMLVSGSRSIKADMAG